MSQTIEIASDIVDGIICDVISVVEMIDSQKKLNRRIIRNSTDNLMDAIFEAENCNMNTTMVVGVDPSAQWLMMHRRHCTYEVLPPNTFYHKHYCPPSRTETLALSWWSMSTLLNAWKCNFQQIPLPSYSCTLDGKKFNVCWNSDADAVTDIESVVNDTTYAGIDPPFLLSLSLDTESTLQLHIVKHLPIPRVIDWIRDYVGTHNDLEALIKGVPSNLYVSTNVK